MSLTKKFIIKRRKIVPKTERVCIKVSSLRELNFENLEEWMADENNIYVGRHGKIFIHYIDDSGNKNRRMFHYKKSKWCNPFPVKEFGLDKFLQMFKEHILKVDYLDDIKELKNKKLGCWCKIGDRCHVDILIEIISMI